MIPCCDTKSGDEIICNGPDSGLPSELGVTRADYAHDWGRSKNDEREPVDFIENIGKSDWRQRFRRRQGVLNVIVGNVEIDGYILLHRRVRHGGRQWEGG